MKFLDKLKDLGKIDNLIKVYNLQENINTEEILKMENHKILEVLEKRLGISKNDEHNYEIISRRLIRDYRIGKIGKFFLEYPKK